MVLFVTDGVERWVRVVKGPERPKTMLEYSSPVQQVAGSIYIYLEKGKVLESMVSAGWETMAAAKPAMRPEPRLTAVWAESDMSFLG